MKLNRDQLLQQNFKVFLQRPGQTRPYKVMFPESVDTDTGTVEMWVIPVEDVDLTAQSTLTNKPPEIDGFAVLKTAQGKVFVLDAQDKTVVESS